MPEDCDVMTVLRHRRASRRAVTAATCVVLLLVGCDGGGGRPGAAPTPSATSSPAARGITKPEGLIVRNAALGFSKKLVRRAIADLKEVGLWKPLTRHLYSIRFASRLGRVNIPEDGHLADAYLTAEIDGNEGGAMCDIMFFPSAMAADLARWRAYHSQGLLPDPPPTIRQFWASITAHELAHCLKHGRGEPTAERWEARALAALRDAGIQ